MNLKLKIVTPRKIVLEKEVQSVTVPSAAGELTILPHHSDLLTLLKEGIITYRMGKDEDYLAIGGGYLETDGEELQILVSRAYHQDEINEEQTKKARVEAEKIMSQSKDSQERTAALSTLRRSAIDMKLLKKRRRPPTA